MRELIMAGVTGLMATAAVQAREPPAPHCVDARTIVESWQSDERTIVLRTADDARHRIELADACPAATAGGELRLLARAGWLCGSAEERVRAGDGFCRIAGVAAIGAREFAGHARIAMGGHDVDLDRVVVTGPRNRRFTGSPAFCLDASHVRSWREDGAGIVVDVSPRRSGGHRRYRVELTGACPGLAGAEGMRLESRLGTTAVCGNPGDRVVPVSASAEPFAGDRYRRAVELPPPPLSRGCPVESVYPIERD